MTNLVSYFALKSPQIHNMNKQELTLPELGWIENAAASFKASRAEVPATHAYLQAYVDFVAHKGAPFQAKALALEGAAINYQRFKNILNTLMQRSTTLTTSGFRGANTIMMMKIMSFSSARDRSNFYLGGEKLVFSQFYAASTDEVYAIRPLSNVHESELLKLLTLKLQDFIRNDDIFVLTLLFLLLRESCDTEEMAMFECTRKMLLKMMSQITLTNPERVLEGFLLDLAEYYLMNRRFVDLFSNDAIIKQCKQ